MLINLLPDFFAILSSTDRTAAYLRYFDAHRSLLDAYWRNYVIDPESPHFIEVVRATVQANRTDLRGMLEHTDVNVLALARQTEARCAELLEIDSNITVVLMVGVGAANAGEIVVDGRGIAFVCLEHFTGVTNRDAQGLGLAPELIPLWLAHEIAHAVRYTSPTSRSEMRSAVDEAGGYYSYWDTGRRIPLRELLVNEGLAVQVARAVSPGHAAWEYFGYERREYSRIRQMETLLSNAIEPDLDRVGLGLRLRYLSGGMSEDARRMERIVIPERAGYYVGAKLVEEAISEHGFPWAIRASAPELTGVRRSAAASA